MADWQEWVATCKRFIQGVDAWPVAADEDFGPNQWEIKPPIKRRRSREH